MDRPRASGKFIWIGDSKLLIKAVSYGTFEANAEGHLFPERDIVRRDFSLMREAGVNAVRTYTLPPQYLMDEAADQGFYVMPGIFWEGRQCIYNSAAERAEVRRTIRESVLQYKDHPALLAWFIGNEIPPDIVRWHGAGRVESFLKDMYHAAKEADPEGLVTYATYPPTEYLDISFFDFASYNVYLLREPDYRSYLTRIQALAGDRPVFLSETGHDSMHSSEQEQAEMVGWQVRGAFEKGLCGIAVFAWTDDWVVGGHRIEDWRFGLVDECRRPKKALEVLSRLYRGDSNSLLESPPDISVVVAAYNAESTIQETLDSLMRLSYPAFEAIVVDDGSSDRTAEIAEKYPVRLIRLGRSGLSAARNAGIQAAEGEIVAFTDADCIVDPDWLFYLAARYAEGGVGGVGGPNIMPESDGWIARCIDRSPGMPRHVLVTPDIAEHVPGCNMSFYRSALLEVGMFDPIYRAAGDDVDICWRLQENGYELAYAAGAMVWHHRRGSVRAYLRQQKGYGRAEILLARKHPLRFSKLGGIRWNGSIYDGLRRLVRRNSRVYQGHFGAGQFQSIYYPHWAGWLYIANTPEWYVGVALSSLAGAAMLVVGLSAWHVAVGAAAAGAVATGLVCAGAAYAAELSYAMPRTERLKMRAIIALLHIAQPLNRTIGRFLAGPNAAGVRARDERTAPERVELTDRYWSSWIDRPHVMSLLQTKIRENNYYVSQGTGWEDWDLEAHSGWVASARIVTAVENQTVLRCRIRSSVDSSIWIPVAAAMAAMAAALPPAASLAANAPFLIGVIFYARQQRRRFEHKLHRILHEVVRSQGYVPVDPAKEVRGVFRRLSARLAGCLKRS